MSSHGPRRRPHPPRAVETVAAEVVGVWFLVAVLLYRTAVTPWAVITHVSDVTLSLTTAVPACMVALLTANAMVLTARLLRTRDNVTDLRNWLLCDLAASVVVVLLAALQRTPSSTVDMVAEPYWALVRTSVAGLVVVRVRAAAVAVAVVPALSVTLAVLSGRNSGPSPAADLVPAWLDLAVTLGVALALLTGVRFMTERVVVDGLRGGRRLERRDQQLILHDTVLQGLETIAMRATIEGQPPMERLRAVEYVARTQIADLRATLLRSDPHPDGPDADREDDPEPLAEVEDVVAAEIARAASVDLHVERGDRPPQDASLTVTDEVAEALGGALREALNNVRRHAGVNRATIITKLDARGLLVAVRDEGRGFDLRSTSAGFGIAESMMNRMRSVDGSCEVLSAPDAGTEVRLRLPQSSLLQP